MFTRRKVRRRMQAMVERLRADAARRSDTIRQAAQHSQDPVCAGGHAALPQVPAVFLRGSRAQQGG